MNNLTLKSHPFFCLLICFMLFIGNCLMAQAPQGMNYQAVERITSGAILSNETISPWFTITNGNAFALYFKFTVNTGISASTLPSNLKSYDAKHFDF